MKLYLALATSFLLFSCKQNSSQKSDTKFGSGVSIVKGFQGHEYITMFAALDIFNDKNKDLDGIKELIGSKNDAYCNSGHAKKGRNVLPFRQANDYCIIVDQSPLILGVTAVDWLDVFPELQFVPKWNEVLRTNINNNEDDWQVAPEASNMHFLRSMKADGSNLDNVEAAYNKSLMAIKTWTKFALDAATLEDKALAKRLAVGFMGAALHTIQDSFSKAHTIRDKNYDLVDICIYGSAFERKDVCFHSIKDHEREAGGGSVLHDDKIHSGDDIIMRETIKAGAEIAVQVSYRYLMDFSKYVIDALNGKKIVQQDLDNDFNNFFTNRNGDVGRGYFKLAKDNNPN